ncbi:hypothetical protein E3E38_08335 [Thermococcus sp. 18S1]|nr:hypothetical protein [Thermococcus sp. 18S1]NJE31049.1 hypothetical protein [Thermococcus sp. 18S1]
MVTLVFVLTQPGAIAFANWDAPYGFYKDLATWMEASFGGLLVVLVLGLHRWRKGNLNPIHPAVTVILLGAVGYIGLTADNIAFSEMGITHSFPEFVVGSILALILAVMSTPISIPHAITGELYYPYDRPLVIAWLVMMVATLLLGAAYLKERRREELTESEGRGPSVSSSEPRGP